MGLKISGNIFYLLAVLIICITPTNAQKTSSKSEVEVGLRMIGHKVLLQYQDSTSRVLPIRKEADHYRIELGADFSFVPEELVSTIDAVVSETQLAFSYIVEVEECETGQVVYSYKMDELAQQDIVPCQSRIQKKACYNLLFYIMDPESDAALDTAAIDSSPDSRVAGFSSSMVLITMALLLGMMLFFLWRRMGNTDPDLIALGSYQFDKRNIVLIKDDLHIPLTSKEADLLLLLNNSANSIVPREELLNKVWGDDGDYIGRTLDVFISKLRKKLEADPALKIINARGVGYKLIINN